jgi:phosphoglycerate dehydrogenase-like enzyme
MIRKRIYWPMSKKIVVVHKLLDPELAEKIIEKGSELGYRVEYYKSVEEALPACADAEIIYGGNPALVKAAPLLKWYNASSVGVDAYLKDKDLLKEDVILTNSAGAYGPSVSEHGLMTTLMVLRREWEYASFVQNRVWKNDLLVGSINGSYVTILGTGDIGTGYAEKVRGCGASHITGINRSGHAAGDVYDETAAMADIDAYLPLTDILFMCLPGTPETTGILSEERIASMKKTAVVINVGRGSAVDQKALIRAINEKRIGGAALDVFETEPIPEDDPVWNTPGLLVTTHNAGNMTAAVTRRRNVDQFLENLECYTKDLPMKHVVRRDLGY